MKEHSYNRQLLQDYLFSALPAEKIERLDELSFTDERFVEELRVVEDDLVDAYASGELETKLRAQFETRYLSSPLRREKVAFSKALRDYGIESRKVAPHAPNLLSSLRTFFPKFLASRGLQWTFAIVLLILIGVSGWLIFQNRRFTQIPPQTDIAQRDAETTGDVVSTPTQEPERQSTKLNAENISPEARKAERGLSAEVASIALAPQIRSGTEVPAVSVKSTIGYVAVQLDLEPNEYSVYRVQLLQPTTGKILWRANNLSSRKHEGDQSINLRLPATLLRSESYVLRVFGSSQKGTSELISDYRFRVVK